MGNVFRWLQENASLEKPLSHLGEQKPELYQTYFCATCGTNVSSHRKTPASDLNLGGTICGSAIARLPLVDVSWWIRRHRQPDRRSLQFSDPRFKEKDLIGACHPSLLMTSAFLLVRMKAADMAGATYVGSELEAGADSRASAALLGLIMEVYIRKLVQMGRGVSQELTRLVGVPNGGPQCLTRSHVYRAILQGAFKGGLPEAIFTSCAEIGSASTVFGTGQANPNVIT